MTEAPLLEVRGLTTTFQTNQGPLRAVNNVSFVVGAGETLGIVGESGSGKTVLMRSITRLLPREAVSSVGEVSFDGNDLMRRSHAELRRVWGKDIGWISQNPLTSLNPVQTIGRQVAEPMRLHWGMRRREALNRAAQLLDSVGIARARERLGAYPHEFSGGMRQRVAIAMALACEPKLLIADEPTTALDVTVQEQILDLLQLEQERRQMTLIIVTHDMGVVAGRTGRVAVMYAGRLVETGSTIAIFERTRHRYTHALISSIPRIENPPHTRLTGIPGRPPDLLTPAPGCPFQPRCDAAIARCVTEMPPMVGDGLGSEYACWVPVGTVPSEGV